MRLETSGLRTKSQEWAVYVLAGLAVAVLVESAVALVTLATILPGAVGPFPIGLPAWTQAIGADGRLFLWMGVGAVITGLLDERLGRPLTDTPERRHRTYRWVAAAIVLEVIALVGVIVSLLS